MLAFGSGHLVATDLKLSTTSLLSYQSLTTVISHDSYSNYLTTSAGKSRLRSKPKPEPQPFRLLDLPPEIRDQIYERVWEGGSITASSPPNGCLMSSFSAESRHRVHDCMLKIIVNYACVGETRVTYHDSSSQASSCCSGNTQPTRPGWGLLLANKQISTEALHVLYSQTPLRILHHHPYDATFLLREIASRSPWFQRCTREVRIQGSANARENEVWLEVLQSFQALRKVELRREICPIMRNASPIDVKCFAPLEEHAVQIVCRDEEPEWVGLSRRRKGWWEAFKDDVSDLFVWLFLWFIT